jgi:cytochrome c oxidase accessory protein FixG
MATQPSPHSDKTMNQVQEAPIQLFAKRKKLYPRRVWGKYRKLKWAAMIVLLMIYYLVPFLRWDRGPHVPDQAVLIDMPNRRAYFFFLEIWPQEVYYLTGILILAAVGLFFVTSLFGRVWCGYACPQTVWTDLFIWVERLVQGDRNQRMKLDASPWNFNKIWRKGLTHSIWLMIGFLTGGAWVFYFNDAPTLLDNMLHFEVPMSVMGWVYALTFSTYLMAGFAREQVCTYMCPYARFQSAMFDKDTLIIGYDVQRGEPRGSHKKGDSWENRGHCVDCEQCVVVCPMGIDIREGLQMQCIACGHCVDACNNVMDKLGLPRGLVRYDTTHNQEARLQGLTEKSHILRPRTLYYSVIMAIVGSVMLYGLLHRSPVELHVLHDRNPLFVTLSDGSIRNGYDVKILNKTHEDRIYSLSLDGLENAELRIEASESLNPQHLRIFADSVGHFRVFVTTGIRQKSRKEVTFTVKDNQSGAVDYHDSLFISKATP